MNAPWLRIGVLALVAALATASVGWWTAPLIGVVFAFVTTRRGRPFPVVIPFVALLLGWSALVAVAAMQGGAGRVAMVMGGVLGLPPWALFVVTPLYGASLAAAGGLVASGLTASKVTV